MTTQPVDDSAARAAQSEQEKEWSQWVAVQTITVGNARAYNVGDPVPASNVSALGYDKDGLVAKRGTKAAAKALGEDA